MNNTKMALDFAIRSGILVGSVYYTNKIGVWGNPEEADKLYNNAKSFASPYVTKLEKQLPFEVPKLPKACDLRFAAKNYYNEGVKGTIRFVHMMPSYAGRLAKKTKETISQSFPIESQNGDGADAGATTPGSLSKSN